MSIWTSFDQLSLVSFAENSLVRLQHPHQQLPASPHAKGKGDHRIGRLSEEYYHVLIGLCFGFVLLIYVLIHIIVSVHDILKRRRYGAMFESRKLIDDRYAFDEEA